MKSLRSPPSSSLPLLLRIVICFALPPAFQAGAAAQTGRVTGTVVDAVSEDPLANVQVTIDGTATRTITGSRGDFDVARVPSGAHEVVFTLLGYETLRQSVTLSPGETAHLQAGLKPGFVALDEVLVIAGSRRPARVLETPAAVSVLPREEILRQGGHGQLPRLLLRAPGIHVAQGDEQDFNVNARGFNSSLNRRVLVLHDGIDRSVGFLQSQEWWALGRSLDALERIEIVRGPGSAVYGPNAFGGVINITTPAPAAVLGTRLALAGGLPENGRFDLLHGEVSDDARWGFKANAGFQSSWETFSSPRTRENARGECPPAARECTFEYGPLPVEDVRLDLPTSVLYGSVRLDRSVGEKSVLTLETGATRVRDQLLVVDFGRVQGSADRPWARLNLGGPRWNVLGWWDSRYDDETTLLTGGAEMNISDERFHLEAQGNWVSHDERLRIVGGASNRWTSVAVRPPILEGPEDGHDDTITSVYAQLEAEPTSGVSALAAARFDHFTVLEASRLSPKATLVLTPRAGHSLRLAFDRAYQTPNLVELFINVDAAPPVPLDEIERELEAEISRSEGRPVDLPLGFGPTPFRGRGNDDLDVEELTAYEIGYKGVLWDGRAFATLDVYRNEIHDFITDLLPGVNPDFRPFALPPAFEDPELARFAPLVLAALRDDPVLGPIFPLLSVLPDGSLEYVLSYTNAGQVEERGLEAGLTFLPAPRWELSGSYTLFDFDVEEASLAPGQRLEPNTPTHKLNLGATYVVPGRFDVALNAHGQTGFDWLAGGFAGRVPGYAILDFASGWHWGETRLSLTWTNMLDKDHYELYGGSVLGSRVILGAALSL